MAIIWAKFTCLVRGKPGGESVAGLGNTHIDGHFAQEMPRNLLNFRWPKC